MISFYKIEATGNDFIVFDEKAMPRESITAPMVRFLCDRHLGIGADGLIFLQRKHNGRLHMTYFNADGSLGAMCGNGLRAAARYARERHLFGDEEQLGIEASDGWHSVGFNNDGTIEVEIFAAAQSRENPDLSRLSLPASLRLLGYLNTGVPHLVLESTQPIEEIPLETFAPSLAHDPLFAQGTNVNVMQKKRANQVLVRTFERGVEAETLSCGTGVTAVALLVWQRDPSAPAELRMQTKGGMLKVSRQKGRIILSGPATLVFVGKIRI